MTSSTSDAKRSVSLLDQSREVDREIALRVRVYKGLVEKGKMTQAESDEAYFEF